MINEVRLSKRADKQLRKLPQHIVFNLMAWVDDVERNGLEEARKRTGYHDEPLRGRRKGQRSVRLSRAYRAVYEIYDDGSIQFVSVEEVSNHEY